MKPFWKRLLPYLVTALIAGAMTVGVYLSRGLTADSGKADRYRALCDAFTVPGILLIAFGILFWASSEGAFTGVKWLLRNAIYLLIPGKALDRVSYSEYLKERSANKTRPHACMFVIGGLFLLIAVLFLVLFNGVAEV
ncbi:MAG: DUF3899 domain-containing protein [Lachnospiraceae bacterium]|nr:DUF3899 domain-containing protein [Lachnospiraceae bacterium]